MATTGFSSRCASPVGWLYQVTGFQITDSFGIVAQAGPISNPNGTRWTLYEITADANLKGRVQHAMLLPDSVDGIQEGTVLEETLLARDEMANLAWAIEEQVQERLGRAARSQPRSQAALIPAADSLRHRAR